MSPPPDSVPLKDFEILATELARVAGAEIEAAMNRTVAVDYKGTPASTRDPVSEVDNSVEILLRARIGEQYPEHDIIGEEIDERPGRHHSHVWAVDPVDGTANFVNGLPLFASSIGLLIDGTPEVGAVWCSTSHLLRPGVYSAHTGGTLNFDGNPMVRQRNANLRAGLLGLPGVADLDSPRFHSRKTGSAALECAFVAAGLLAGAHFLSPNLWDVAAGVVLVKACSLELLQQRGNGWNAFEKFELASMSGDLRLWSSQLVMGKKDATAALIHSDAAARDSLR